MTFDLDTWLDVLFWVQALLSVAFLAAAFLLLPLGSKAVALHRVILGGLAVVTFNLYSLLDITLTLEAGRLGTHFVRLLASDMILTVVAACAVHLGRQAAGDARLRGEVPRP